MTEESKQQPHLTDIGPYRILRVIGEGGMGVVYEAEQCAPVRRRVALKVIKLGMDTAQVVARFEAERQALAVMSHPNIARMLDAGATEEGRPYFVMELVEGEPLTRYCDRNRLTTRERTRLFLQALNAVQHAHVKGVVHRDLKPSNILVDATGGRPIVKIIDFGIAKAVDERIMDATRVTRLGQLLGTPAYMSPEQAEQSDMDIDARTDVYSLGVVLYELLAGSLPFDRQLFGRPEFIFQYLLRDTEAPTPSARFASLADTQVTVAQNRRTGVRHLRRELRGDLDWIVMKAMEKNRGRRYGTPLAFAEDVERYLRGEPVVARPPTIAYRTGRFARRHRWGVSFAAVLVSLLLGGSGALSVQAARLAEERDSAREMASFLQGLFEATDPYEEGRRDTLNISQFVRLGAERVRSELHGEPAIQARMFVLLAKVFRNLERYDEARALMADGLALYESLEAETSEEVTGSRELLAHLMRDMGEAAAAADLFERVAAVRRAEGHPATNLGYTLLGLGNARQDLGEYDEAEAAYAEAADLLATVHASDDPTMLQALNNLGTVRVRKSDHEGAEEVFRSAYETGREALGDDHPLVLSIAGNLGYVLRELRRFDEAAALAGELLERARDRFSGANGIVARALNNLGAIHLEAGDPARAERYLVEALTMRRAIHGSDHPDLATTQVNLGTALLDLGRSEEAAPMLEDALRIYEAAFGPDHPRVATALGALGRVEHEAGRHDRAVELYRRVEAIRAARLGEDHPLTASARIDLGRDLMETGDRAAAEQSLMASYRTLRDRASEGARLRLALGYLLDLSLENGDGAGAARYQEELRALSS
ncbi:MAG TPA: serine/threonine-protein kinase [Longimicrobiales bacterium]|nr:serine/threonine-protein kinase [Longimicrobiales bacterium]